MAVMVLLAVCAVALSSGIHILFFLVKVELHYIAPVCSLKTY